MSCSHWTKTALAVFFVCCLLAGCGKRESAVEAERAAGKGETYFQAGLYRDALEQFQEALRHEPADSRLHLLVGQCFERLGMTRQAQSSYETALRYNPELPQAHTARAELLWQGNQIKELEAAVEEMQSRQLPVGLVSHWQGRLAQLRGEVTAAQEFFHQAIDADPNDVASRRALADLYQQEGNSTKAIELLATVYQSDPTEVRIGLDLARLYALDGDNETALKILGELVEQKPEDSQLRARMAVFLLEQGRTAEAEKEARAALNLNASNGLAMYVAGAAAVESGNYEQAIADLEAAQELLPGDERVRQALRQARVGAGVIVDRIELVQKRIRSEGTKPELLVELANAQLERGDGLAARETAEKIIQEFPDQVDQAHELMALGYLVDADLPKAHEILQQITPGFSLRTSAMQALFDKDFTQLQQVCQQFPEEESIVAWGGYFAGLGFLAQKQISEALREYDIVTVEHPTFAPAYLEMARLYQRINESQLAYIVYQRLLEHYPDSVKVSTLVAQLLLERGNTERALVLVDGILKRDPNNEAARFLRGSAYLKKKEFTNAAQAFRELLANTQRTGDELVLLESILAKTLIFGKDYPAALDQYEQILSKHPDNTIALIEKALVHMLLEEPQQSVNTLADAMQGAEPAPTNLAVVYAVALQQIGDEATALGVIENLPGSEQLQPVDKAALAPVQAGIMVTAGRTEEAAELIASTTRYTELSEFYRLTIDNVGRNVSQLRPLNMAFLFSYYDWPDAAISVLQQLRRRHSEDLLLIALLAENQQRAGMAEEAFATLKEGLDLAPDNLFFLENHGLLASELGQYETAIQDLIRCLNANPQNSKIHFQLGSIYQRQQLSEDAIAAYRRALDFAKDPVSQASAANNLAWLLASSEDTLEEAQSFARQAYEIAPLNPRTGKKDGNILDTVGWVHFMAGDYESARKYIEEALTVLPSQPTITYHLGRVYEALEDLRLASHLYLKALDFNPAFPEANDARIRLTKLAMQMKEK